MEKIYGSIDGQNTNELVRRLLEQLPSDPGATTSRFFFNTTDKRIKIADGSGGYRSIAWVNDLVGLSNWKSPIKAASTVAGGNVTLSGLQTIDDVSLSDGDYVLIKDQTNLTENGFYQVSSGAWTRIVEADTGTEITNSMCIVEQGTENGGTIWKNTDNDPLTVGTDDIHFAQLNITVPVTDETVKVSMSDTTEKYLRESFSNVDASGDALNNVDNIQFILENAGSNEALKVALDLSSYTGDVNITGGLSVSGTTTLNDLAFSAGSTINRDNTTNTGTQNFDNGYTANYDGSTINWNNGTVVTLDSTSTINIDGTTNYSSTSVTNNDGGTINNTNTTVNNVGVTENYDDTSVTNNNGNTTNNTDTTVNNEGATINNISAPTLLGCSGDQIVNVSQIDTPINSDAEYAEISVTYDSGGTDERTTSVTLDPTNTPQVVTDPGSTLPGQITFVWNDTSGNIEATRDSGSADFTINVCQFDLDANPTVINNDNTVTNNTNVTENYTSVFTPIGCSGANALPVDEPIDPSATKADVEIVYDDGTNTDTTTVTVTDGMGIVTSTLLDATITTERNNTSGNIEVRLTAGSGTATADVCQFSGGSIINNNSTIENNTDNITNNNGTTENNTNVNEYYDGDSTVTNEGDVYNSNLTVENISYAESYVAGEDLTNRQPLRMGVDSLGEDTTKVYGANSTDTDHSEFIGFASKDALANEELAVLKGPRVDGLKAVYGALTDGSTYYLQDDGTIGLSAGTVSKILGDADGDDALVGLNTPLPPASLIPPKQLKANNTGTVGQVATYFDKNTFEWKDQTGGGAGDVELEHFVATDGQTDFTLTRTPASPKAIRVSQASGLYAKQDALYDYTVSGDTITLNTPANDGDVISVQYLVALPNPIISDEAYGPTRSGVDTIAPSKNAVYNKIESLNTGGIISVSGQIINKFIKTKTEAWLERFEYARMGVNRSNTSTPLFTVTQNNGTGSINHFYLNKHEILNNNSNRTKIWESGDSDNGSRTSSLSYQIGVDSSYVYFACTSTNDTSPTNGFFKKDFNGTTIASTTTNQPSNLLCDDEDEFIYGISGTTLHKYAKTDLLTVDSYALTAGGRLALDDTYVYVVQGNDILKINRSSMLLDGTYTGDSDNIDMVHFGTNLFLLTADGYIRKIDTATMTQIAINNTITNISTFLVAGGSKLYTRDTSTDHIISINQSDLTVSTDKYINLYGGNEGVSGEISKPFLYNNGTEKYLCIFGEKGVSNYFDAYNITDIESIPEITSDKLFSFYDGSLTNKTFSSTYIVS